MARFVPVAKVSERSPGQMKMVVADRERLLLVNMAGLFYAISDECGHDWAPSPGASSKAMSSYAHATSPDTMCVPVSSSAGHWRTMCPSTRCGSQRTRSM